MMELEARIARMEKAVTVMMHAAHNARVAARKAGDKELEDRANELYYTMSECEDRLISIKEEAEWKRNRAARGG